MDWSIGGRGVTEALLEVRDLHKHFGGVVATDIAHFAINSGETHALIGPNGAGKTTFISQLSGEIAVDHGCIRFRGEDITALAPYTRSQRGLARSFQLTSVFAELSVLDNVCLAVQSRHGHSYRFFANARDDHVLRAGGREALKLIGLDSRADVFAGALSHGECRQLELAMVLATAPSLLLLDEPMAGMGGEESAAMLALLKQVKSKKSILLVEHDMDAVFAIADRISVLVNGRIIASGEPAAIRSNEVVTRAYLGEDDLGEDE